MLRLCLYEFWREDQAFKSDGDILGTNVQSCRLTTVTDENGKWVAFLKSSGGCIHIRFRSKDQLFLNSTLIVLPSFKIQMCISSLISLETKGY
ncbi:hypothetical protein PIB30_028461 [Stylosanthes scabra]|uniref:Uncharacterized protein n=1 Tax=Stylosanthes scabra TaxID=79078 RepID=A0ABU6X8K1_9FABA|nr:hypothetical protein [Stylosanthes scabra]